MKNLRVLIAHNFYRQRGGEDSVVESEMALLKYQGHDVETYFRCNDEIEAMSAVSVTIQTLWSSSTVTDLTSLVRFFQPDVIHAHNTLPLISPTIYWAAARAGVPVVQTLHNFRLMCLNALFLRGGSLCEDCVGKLPWRGVVHKCYRGAGAPSTVLAGMHVLHRILGTYVYKVDRFIALTEFAKKKFVEAGFPEHKIAIKPNFYLGEGILNHAGDEQAQGGALFVGRISPEKGICTLIKTWRQLDIPLKIVGGGPLLDEIKNSGLTNCESLGPLSPEQVSSAMAKAAFLVLPSECYENFPLTLAEAFAHGLPVIASRLGAMAEIVEDGVTGLHFEPGNAEDLAAKVRWMNDHPEERRQMGYNARRVFEQNYTPDRNYEMLMKIYREAIDEKKQSRQS